MRDAMTAGREQAEVEAWLAALPEGPALTAVAARLRAAAGGAAGGGGDEVVVASYFAVGPRDPAALRRLIADPALRREVAGVGRLLDQVGAAPSPAASRARWIGGVALALAASLALLAVLPDTPSTHRAATITAAELHVLTPGGAQAGPPEVAWERVLLADLYEVEVTGADGRPVFRDRTVDTAVRLPDSVLTPGVSYFFRVRARLEAGRWIASDFRGFVVRP